MGRITRAEMIKYLKLYFIFGSQNTTQLPEQVVKEAIEGGITLFQYREKGEGSKAGAEKVELARKLQEICRQNGIPFIVNDDIDLAVQLNADGLHVGQEDIGAKEARKMMGDKILGVSAYTIDEGLEAAEDGADYLGLGPIYATGSKDDAAEEAGPQVITLFRKMGIKTPIVGIGGIYEDNIDEVMKSGSDGISIISAIASAPSPLGSAKNLKKRIENYL
ncbi:thiamine phosphate synthase [Bacillus sp. FJAT-44742]|uniref:thiamine phosphate synthase n=1 Tax=Bacillus sp. FJAT-44742 TaxID=2014005 RepID=UPI000C249869|nr:thiamine phosphate synthase [Bacillus sp. FJAT-44742]